MNEKNWLTTTRADAMLYDVYAFVGDVETSRKLRLFQCAWCRSLSYCLASESCQSATDISELYADSLASKTECQAAYDAVLGDLEKATEQKHWDAVSALGDCLLCVEVVQMMRTMRGTDPPPSWHSQRCRLLRDIFGNPFRPLKPQASWLSWNDGAIVKAADAAYSEREMPSGHLDNTRLAVLADMLEEAGCSDAQLLEHLRDREAVHVRGCWALDLILGKE